MFVLTLITRKEYYKNSSIVCADNGDVIGRILSRKKSTFPTGENYFFYDIESFQDIYSDLEQKKIRLYRVDDYDVCPCHTYYTQKMI